MEGHKLRAFASFNDVSQHHLNFWRYYRDENNHLCEDFYSDSLKMLQAGGELGARISPPLLKMLGWDKVDKTICHQVSRNAHQIMYRRGLIFPESDFSSYETCGNMGSVALPGTCALAIEQSFLKPNDKVAWLGIGSGLNIMLMAWDW
jgi:3-oxoacyl-[acyl-carrier-protein] synthase-3